MNPRIFREYDIRGVADRDLDEAFVTDLGRTIVPHLRRGGTRRLAIGPRRFKVVVDAGNGAGGPTCVPLLESLGFDVVPLYCDMDGRFPNHHPDPTVEENVADLKREVARQGAELGIALDGDADR